MVNKRQAYVYQFSYTTKRNITQNTKNRQKLIMYCNCFTLKAGVDDIAYNIAPREDGVGYDIIFWVPAYSTPSRVARDINSFYKKVFKSEYGNKKGVMDFPLTQNDFLR